MSDRSKRLRVLVVSLGRRGGINEYAWRMARALDDQCDIALLTSVDADNAGRWVTLGRPHLAVSTFSTVPGLLTSFLRFGVFSRIRSFAREFAPDVVYYPGGHAWKPLLDLILPRCARVVLTVHDPELHAGEDSLAHRVLAASNRVRLHGVVLLNETQRSAYIARHRLDPEAVAVIPLGAESDDRLALPLEQIDGLESVAPFAGRYALFVGRIERYKGLEVLLSAYRDAGTGPEFPLVIAGSGEFSAKERDLLRSLADRPVVVVNRWLSETEVASLVKWARFIVAPYTSATQSGVIPLAAAFGIPSIASDAGGLAEQVVDGKTGMIFSSGDCAALAATLRLAFALDADAYTQMSAAARAHAHENWSRDVLGERLAAFLRAVAGSSGQDDRG